MKHYFLNLTDTFSINYVVRSHTDVLFVPNSSCWLSVFLFGLDLEQLVYSLKEYGKMDQARHNIQSQSKKNGYNRLDWTVFISSKKCVFSKLSFHIYIYKSSTCWSVFKVYGPEILTILLQFFCINFQNKCPLPAPKTHLNICSSFNIPVVDLLSVQ